MGRKRIAWFLGVPCFFDDGTFELTPRYGRINDFILSGAISFWLFLGEVIPCFGEAFPIEIKKD